VATERTLRAKRPGKQQDWWEGSSVISEKFGPVLQSFASLTRVACSAQGVTAGLFVTDRDSASIVAESDEISHYKTLSNAGVAALVGGAGGMWAMGHVSHNEHWSETGFLAGEAR